MILDQIFIPYTFFFFFFFFFSFLIKTHHLETFLREIW